MTTITKERLLTIKEWRETYGPGSNVVLPAEEAEELARIAQLPFRIKSQSDLEEFKSALSKVCGFHANAITSLSYLGREEEE